MTEYAISVELQNISALVSVYFSLAQDQMAINCLEQQLALAREIKASKEEGQALFFCLMVSDAEFADSTCVD